MNSDILIKDRNGWTAATFAEKECDAWEIHTYLNAAAQ